MWAKRIFHKIPTNADGIFELSNTPSVCRDLEWFAARFPLDIEHEAELRLGSEAHREHIASLDELIDPRYKPPQFKLAIPARDYQRRAAAMFLKQGYLLLADDVGLGKTAVAIAALTEPATLPAVVVCLAHLPRQWEREIHRFAPDLRTHVISKRDPYELPKHKGRGPDVLLCSYHKLAGWQQVLAAYCKTIVFDEGQELRRNGTPQSPSQKYYAARTVSERMEYRLALTATPIYNYGGEFFNVMEVIAPGALGTRSEFLREWCTGGEKPRLTDQVAFGSWLRENHLMLRRTRHEVGRELPPLSRITHTIDSDTAALDKITDAAGELARIILQDGEQRRGQKMKASEEFNNLLRQATGIAKAPHVAAFVNLLLDNGEPVVLYGWHRAVYEIWLSKLKGHCPALYTGSESNTRKAEHAAKFIEGDTNLLIVSLRSGAGLDGLQKRCRSVVFGELDWSPGVHEQCCGRVFRDGQPDPVTAYFLVSEDGADPLMSEVLGLKRDQIEGVRADGRFEIVERVDDGESIRKLAREWLARR